ncbi:hydroxymethylbilane synthase [Anaplasma marginale]|uniref:hydroxymethylbilane synthase n=1 Tax=Anaplasma marginale TaxID=770 RepID=UPI00123A6BB3|nr:hydroxymethylbilane synthase [Anaplasma marginale]KAA8472361.1 hydroxymethylbilane synthase [Anaplasma marginale]KAB0450615.1 hydroxymethylbilane synthase [Anaplasma marginale]KAB0452057.1 hydroxymethylbilane synthase [Anaplasma marginale]
MYAPVVRLGTRGSTLALIQAEEVKAAIAAHFPEVRVDVIKIKTSGDVKVDRPLCDIGGKGLFIKEIEEALLANKIDIAVHSAKDVPGFYSENLDMPCVLKRRSPMDVFISVKYKSLNSLPAGAKIGTSSIRRKVQLLAFRPDLEITPMRGNVDTRIAKVQSGECDGIVLAEAGVDRISARAKITEVLHPDVMLGAVGQGAICVQCRKSDEGIVRMLAKLNDHESFTAVLAERSFMKAVNGSCHTPLAAMARYVDSGLMSMKCMLAHDSRTMVSAERTFPERDAESVGFEMGVMLKDELRLRGV